MDGSDSEEDDDSEDNEAAFTVRHPHGTKPGHYHTLSSVPLQVSTHEPTQPILKFADS